MPAPYEVAVEGHRVDKIHGYVEYELCVRHVGSGGVWHIFRRYSAFRRVHLELQRGAAGSSAGVLPPAPVKYPFWRRSEEIIPERSVALQEFVRALLAAFQPTPPVVLALLGVESPAAPAGVRLHSARPESPGGPSGSLQVIIEVSGTTLPTRPVEHFHVEVSSSGQLLASVELEPRATTQPGSEAGEEARLEARAELHLAPRSCYVLEVTAVNGLGYSEAIVVDAWPPGAQEGIAEEQSRWASPRLASSPSGAERSGVCTPDLYEGSPTMALGEWARKIEASVRATAVWEARRADSPDRGGASAAGPAASPGQSYPSWAWYL